MPDATVEERLEQLEAIAFGPVNKRPLPTRTYEVVVTEVPSGAENVWALLIVSGAYKGRTIKSAGGCTWVRGETVSANVVLEVDKVTGLPYNTVTPTPRGL